MRGRGCRVNTLTASAHDVFRALQLVCLDPQYPAVKIRSLDRSIARQPRRAHLGMAPYLNKEAIWSKTLAERVVREVHLDNFHAAPRTL